MKSKRVNLCILLLTILLFSNYVCVFAGSMPNPTDEFYIYDEVGIIDQSAVNYIINTNESLNLKTGAQVVVAIINSLDDMDIREYANLLFEKWKIGSKEYDNGVLMLVSPNDREIWIEIGYGLEGALPDGKVGRIMDNSIIPSFRDENYSEGILNGFNAIIDEIENEYNINLEREKLDEELYYHNTGEDYSVNILNKLGVIGVVILIIIFLFIDFKFFNGWLTYAILRSSRYGGGSSSSGRSNRGGGGSSGGGGAGRKW